MPKSQDKPSQESETLSQNGGPSRSDFKVKKDYPVYKKMVEGWLSEIPESKRDESKFEFETLSPLLLTPTKNSHDDQNDDCPEPNFLVPEPTPERSPIPRSCVPTPLRTPNKYNTDRTPRG